MPSFLSNFAEETPKGFSINYGLPQITIIETAIYKKHKNELEGFLEKQYKEFLEFFEKLS